jgi:hypothetical protein
MNMNEVEESTLTPTTEKANFGGNIAVLVFAGNPVRLASTPSVPLRLLRVSFLPFADIFHVSICFGGK